MPNKELLLGYAVVGLFVAIALALRADLVDSKEPVSVKWFAFVAMWALWPAMLMFWFM